MTDAKGKGSCLEPGVCFDPPPACSSCAGRGFTVYCGCFMYDCGEFTTEWENHCPTKRRNKCNSCKGTGIKLDKLHTKAYTYE